MDFQREIKKLIQKTSPINLDEFGDINIEVPADNINGDFSTSFALSIFKKFKDSDQNINEISNPLSLADLFVSKINIEKISWIEKIEVAKPGFINFYLNKHFLIEETIKKALSKNFYLYSNDYKTKVIVEHTSVNPNKAMHIGHLRNSFIGDAIASILKKYNYNVEIHNYIDDTGVQVADTTLGIIKFGDLPVDSKESFDDYTWDIYAKVNRLYESEPSFKIEREDISKELEKCEGDIFEKSQQIVNRIVKCHRDLLRQFGIKYDLFVYESDILKSKFWDAAFAKLKNSKNFYLETEGAQKGCWVLSYHNPKFNNKIFVRSNGTVVYTAKDLAYHMWKFGVLGKDFNYLIMENMHDKTYRTSASGSALKGLNFGNADRIVTVVDERQEYPQEMVRYGLKAVGYDSQYENYKHLSYGVVNLSAETARELGVNTEDDKNAYAMSGRKGIGVKAKDVLKLLEDKIKEQGNSQNATSIAVSALKHYMLKYNLSTEIIFDYATALNLKGNTGPYLQYSLARAKNILSKLDESLLVSEFVTVEGLDENAFDLVKTMSEWEGVLYKASNDFILSYISDYAFRLSSSFHKFYETNNVLKSEGELQLLRVAIVKSFVNTITDVFEVLGIEPVESM